MLPELQREKCIESAYNLISELNRNLFSLQDTKEIICYYFKKYKAETGIEHPEISGKQLMFIIENMPYFNHESKERKGQFDIRPGDYKELIDLYFKCRSFQTECNYQIAHFFSGKIRMMRSAELRKIRERDKISAEAVPMPEYIKHMDFYRPEKKKCAV